MPARKRKNITTRTHVFSSAFHQAAMWFGARESASSLDHVCDILSRDRRTVRDWIMGNQPCPKWAYDLLLLTREKRERDYERMTGKYRRKNSDFAYRTRLIITGHFQWPQVAANDPGEVVEIIKVVE